MLLHGCFRVKSAFQWFMKKKKIYMLKKIWKKYLVFVEGFDASNYINNIFNVIR